jgi:DNA polymerase-1
MDIYLIDGNSYVYRAYYAIRGLTDSKGRPTNAVFGFTNMLMKIIRERRPDGLVVSFDTPHPTARHELYEAYKAGRPETPQDLLVQIPGIKDVVGAMRIRVFEMPGFEADDVLATLAEKAAMAGMNVYIVSNDKDMLQLVGGPVKVYDPMKDLVIDEGRVRERFGVPPARVTEFMALVGDPSDNIPGVRGVGEKTAKELLSEFSTLDELMAHPEKIKKERIRKLIEGGLDDIKLSRELARIKRDVPLEAASEDFRLREPDWGRLRELFREFEFTSLLKLLPVEEPPGVSYEAVLDRERLVKLLLGMKGGFAVDTEATGRNPLLDRLVGFSICSEEGRAAYVPLMHDYEGAPAQMDKGEALDALKPLMEDRAVAKTGHNLKYDILILRGEGVETRGVLYDTMVASYLLNPLRPGHSLENVALEHLGARKTPFKEVAGKGGGFHGVELSRAVDYACRDAELALRLKDVLFSRLGPEGLERTYFEMEMPLIYVLADMEQAGMKLDAGRLGELGGELERELDALRQRIYFFAGGEFNLNSPKQLAAVLFERLGLRPGKKKKTGYSTDVSVLEELAREHELPRDLLTWRTLAKLKNTYVDVLPRLLNPRTGRLHTSFNQAVTATGRLSSSEPNLQNIPVRGEWGTRIREAFVAERGCVIISADYSQIELRILAHLSGDRGLGEAFRDGLDVHARTAAEIFGVKEGKVTPEMRRVAKTVNFGIIYGITPFGLSESLGISRQEAEAYINGYFARHPGVGAYIDRALREARESGFVRTLFGRKRPVPELSSGNRNTRLLGQRLAVNSPVQGSAADIIKMAMIRISSRLRGEVTGARMVLQVHDELVLEAPEGEGDRVSALLREEMQGAAGLSVPVVVDIGSGRNWAEAH